MVYDNEDLQQFNNFELCGDIQFVANYHIDEHLHGWNILPAHSMTRILQYQ